MKSRKRGIEFGAVLDLIYNETVYVSNPAQPNLNASFPALHAKDKHKEKEK